MNKIGIIGCGIGGIATAIRLQLKQKRVTVFESNSYPGGKLSEINSGNFRFDAGPSLFTLPKHVTDLFELAGKNPNDYFQYSKLKEICRYFWDDGQCFIVPSNIDDFDYLIHKELDEKEGKVKDYLKNSEIKYEVLNDLFLNKSLHKLSTWTSKKALKGYMNLHKLGIFGTLHTHNETYFKNPRTTQLFDRYATYNGSNPYKTPATMSIIPHLEYNIGAYFPNKGMHSITESLFKLAKEIGVEFKFSSPVSRIIVEKKKAIGIESLGVEYLFDSIVSNMDVTPTYRKLLTKQTAPDLTLDQEKSGSGLIFYWGISHKFKQLGLHNILFSNNYEAEFEHQFKLKTIYEDPTVYINITSKLNPSDAPEGSENWFVLINAPNNTGQDWDSLIAKTKINVINKISKILEKDISKLINTESLLDPRTIELKTSSSQGALYGNSSNNKYAAFLRHPNFSKSIKNLYFVGGSVHPGGGIPLALSSAKITSELLA